MNANGNGWNAATGLNAGLDAARGAWVVCAHQDVLFPGGWWPRARSQLLAWPRPVGAAGLVGTRSDGAFRGHVLDPHGHRRWLPLPAEVASLDEHLIVVRADAGLRFDPATPGFHCYGTDIARKGRASGLATIALDAPVIHLSGGRLDPSFDEASAWLLGKWGASAGGVLHTPAALLADAGVGARARLWARWRRRRSRRRSACRCATIGRSSRSPAGGGD